MIIQKQILNQSKFIPPGYTLSKDLLCKIILQGHRERSCSVKGAEQLRKAEINKNEKISKSQATPRARKKIKYEQKYKQKIKHKQKI